MPELEGDSELSLQRFFLNTPFLEEHAKTDSIRCGHDEAMIILTSVLLHATRVTKLQLVSDYVDYEFLSRVVAQCLTQRKCQYLQQPPPLSRVRKLDVIERNDHFHDRAMPLDFLLCFPALTDLRLGGIWVTKGNLSGVSDSHSSHDALQCLPELVNLNIGADAFEPKELSLLLSLCPHLKHLGWVEKWQFSGPRRYWEFSKIVSVHTKTIISLALQTLSWPMDGLDLIRLTELQFFWLKTSVPWPRETYGRPLCQILPRQIKELHIDIQNNVYDLVLFNKLLRGIVPEEFPHLTKLELELYSYESSICSEPYAQKLQAISRLNSLRLIGLPMWPIVFIFKIDSSSVRHAELSKAIRDRAGDRRLVSDNTFILRWNWLVFLVGERPCHHAGKDCDVAVPIDPGTDVHTVVRMISSADQIIRESTSDTLEKSQELPLGTFNRDGWFGGETFQAPT
ncbi:MAG: hypothetical protein Q9227_005474 [Pyrenula ochraceoflavens]